MSETKNFHLGDVLSITTGRLVSPRHMDGVYDILNWMTGDQLFTHQLPRAAEECRPSLLRQFPQLADISGDEVSKENHADWLEAQVATFGETLDVAPADAEDVRHVDPIAEADQMMGSKPVHVIRI